MTLESADLVFTAQEKSIFAEARAAFNPGAAEQQRLKLLLASALPISVVLPTTAPDSPQPSQIPAATSAPLEGASMFIGPGIKALGAALALGMGLGGAAGIYWERHQNHQQPDAVSQKSAVQGQTQPRQTLHQSPRTSQASTNLDPDSRSAAAGELEAKNDEQRSPSSNRESSSTEAAPALTFHEELSFLRRAQTALRAQNPSLALGLMRTLDEQLKGGALVSERQVTKVLALCALGRNQEANQLAQRLLKNAPDSVYATRLQSSCARLNLPSPGEK